MLINQLLDRNRPDNIGFCISHSKLDSSPFSISNNNLHYLVVFEKHGRSLVHPIEGLNNLLFLTLKKILIQSSSYIASQHLGLLIPDFFKLDCHARRKVLKSHGESPFYKLRPPSNISDFLLPKTKLFLLPNRQGMVPLT